MEEQEYMSVMKTTSAKSRRKAMVSSSRLLACPCSGSAKDLEGVVTLGGRSDTRRHRRFYLKTGESVTSCGGMREGLTSLASKPEEAGLTGLGLKTRDGLSAVMVWAEGTWRHHETCVEAKRSREGGVSVRCLHKKLDEFATG